ncbi:glucan 1,6-alpha-glucosidase [[Mycoplasma] phocae]|uniref:Glucan 1,6-alpha-glucosidase n=1 Tax=[Mycoplasma] phocae TaxID=142651 RepID=A0A2Z5IQ88_9BACT|nr:alpha-amylase family glycosyl hydrolase [[Mycoplasma] phocae]AXE60692.1 glucan 1,6-alpha-glucosidase [[Mycoplasma] phocae]
MLQNATPRILLYEIKLETFCDSNGSNFGDFNGLLSKKEYLKSLNINVLAINDILSQYQNKFELQEIKKRYGSVSNFVSCVNQFREIDIEIAPIIDISKIKQSYINLNNMLDLYELSNDNNNTKKLTSLDTYLINDNDKNTSLDALSNLIKYLTKVVSFYAQCKVKTIIISNFDFLIDENNLDEANKFQFLQDVYRIIKRINVDITVILKNSYFKKPIFKKMLNLEKQCFDYLYLNFLANNQLTNNFKKAKLQKFNFKIFLKEYKPFTDDKRIILTLGADHVGRINSRWGNELGYIYEAAKTFLMIMFAAHNSVGIYYGDELGILRAKIRKTYDFNNENYNEEKRFYQANNISNEEYFKAQAFQNKWSSYTWMPWNEMSGISRSNENKNSLILSPIKLNITNVDYQLKTQSSPLIFLKELYEFIFKSNDSKLLGDSTIAISSHRKGIIKIQHRLSDNKIIMFVINLTAKHLTFRNNDEYKIILSTYHDKFYSSVPNNLCPFESLILIKENEIIS